MSALEHYASFCGPTALGSALDIPPRAVASLLLVHDKMTVDGGTNFEFIDEVLSIARCAQPRWFADRSGDRAYPTVSQWLREHPVGSYVLYVPLHVLHVADGEVVADSRPGGSLLLRVRYFWPMRWGPADTTPDKDTSA